MRFEPCLLDEVSVKRAGRAGRALNDGMEAVQAALDDVAPGASLSDVADAIDAEAPQWGKAARAIHRLATAVRQTPNLCLSEETATVIEMTEAGVTVPMDRSGPGLYVPDLVDADSCAARIRQTGAIAGAVLHRAKATRGDQPILLVVAEAQNYVPERQTGRRSMDRASFEPLFEIASNWPSCRDTRPAPVTPALCPLP